jgi:ATP-dependent RNA helicase DDX56/DBP9
MSTLLDTSTTFPTLCTTLGIDSRIRKSLSRLNYTHPTLVQSKSIPIAIGSGRDLLVRARTGSGKTLAYCIPVLQKVLSYKLLAEERGVQNDDNEEEDKGEGTAVKAVILVPTRELCTQVSAVLQDLTYYCAEHVKVAVLLGGKRSNSASVQQQEAMLRDRPDVVVATPGGLVDHVKGGRLDLKRSVEMLVVDEADLILSFGEYLV